MWKIAICTLLLLSTYSCGNINEKTDAEETDAEELKTQFDGELFFQNNAADYGHEYLHLKILNNQINGKSYVENAFYGGVMVSFSGEILSKDSISLLILDSEETAPEAEIIHYSFDGKTLRFEGVSSWAFSKEYQQISQSGMPDEKEYGTVAEMEFEMMGEYIENVFPSTYQSVMPDPMKHWGGLHEYFTILEVLDTVAGYGYGERDGEPPWEFHFSGIVEEDSIFLVEVCYHQEGYPDSTLQERWTLDRQLGEFTLAGYNRPVDGRRYVFASENDLIEPVREGLKSASDNSTPLNKGEMYDQRNTTQQSKNQSP